MFSVADKVMTVTDWREICTPVVHLSLLSADSRGWQYVYSLNSWYVFTLPGTGRKHELGRGFLFLTMYTTSLSTCQSWFYTGLLLGFRVTNSLLNQIIRSALGYRIVNISEIIWRWYKWNIMYYYYNYHIIGLRLLFVQCTWMGAVLNQCSLVTIWGCLFFRKGH